MCYRKIALTPFFSERGFDVAVDVVRSAADVAEELGAAEDARAVRDADAEVGLAQSARGDEVAEAEVGRGVERIEQPRGRVAALRQVALLGERNFLGEGQADAEPEARAQLRVPGKAVEVGLDVGADLREIGLEAALLVLRDADKAGEVERPAVDTVDEGAADLETRDAGVVLRVGRGAIQQGDLQHVAVARCAVERAHYEGPARRKRLALGRKVVSHAELQLAQQALADDRAIRHGIRQPRHRRPADQGPALGRLVGGVEPTSGTMPLCASYAGRPGRASSGRTP